MIIIVLAIFAILTFVSWIFIQNVKVRVPAGIISGLLLFATVLALVANFNNHFGMKKVTTTKTQTIYSAGGSTTPVGMLITQEIGTKSNNYVFVFADKADGKATAHFVPNQKDIVNAVKKTATYKTADVAKASVTTKTTRWEWQNDFYEWMFGFGGEGHSLAKQTHVVTVPKDTWVVLTADQAKQVQAQQKTAAADPAAAAAQQAQLKTAVQTKVTAYVTANPSASQAQITAYTQKVTAQLMADAIKTTLK